MEIRFELSGSDDENELRSLFTWLRDDRELRGEVEVEPVTEQRAQGEMGGAIDAIVALVSTGTAMGQLAISIAEWRHARRLPSTVTVTVLSGESPCQAGPVIHALEVDPDDRK